MFDRENPEVYWGFGLIMGQRASIEDPESSLKESIRFLEMANDRAPEDGRIIGDLAFSHTILGHYFQANEKNDKKAQGHFETAGELFSKAYMIAPTYPPITANWSVFYFYIGNYEKAKIKANEAIMLGYRFSPDYIKELESNLK
jgi:tetratricopeptide (TPR) repeat protein